MAFNNHSHGDLLLLPYGYASETPTPEHDLFFGISEELVSQNGFNNMIASELYPAAGDSDDFMYGTVGTHDKIYAFTPEIGNAFWPPSNQIENIAKSMMYLNITAAKMTNNYASVIDTSPAFTGNSATLNEDFSIKRLGLSGDGNFSVSLHPVSSNIEAAGNAVAFNNLTILEETTGTIQYTVNTGIVAGDEIVFELIINNGNYDSKTLITKTFGSLNSIFEDAGNSVTDNYDNNGWDITTSTYVSASSSITDSPTGNYQNNANKTISLSDEVDLTDALGASVSFYAKWDIENNWDYVQFEVSINNGNSWIPQCGNYTNEGSSNGGQPAGEPLYDGKQNDWVLEEIDLSDYLGESIIVRFQLISDGEATEDGFYFDDLKINTLNEGTLSTTDVIESQFSVYPNPVDDILYITTPTANYTIEIYNLQGQLISNLPVSSGSQTLDYSNYASGIYLMKLTSEKASKTFKIVKK